MHVCFCRHCRSSSLFSERGMWTALTTEALTTEPSYMAVVWHQGVLLGTRVALNCELAPFASLDIMTSQAHRCMNTSRGSYKAEKAREGGKRR